MSDLLGKYGYTPYQREADEELEKSATIAPNPLNKYGITTQAQATAEMNPLARAGLGAARGLASALEPLALPQDIAFAVVGGGLDDDTTIGDRLRTIEWGKYTPFGQTPARPANGAEILGLMGVENERAQRWGGLVMDLTADPLIAGAAIRGVGKLGKLEDLVKLGDRVDEWSSYAVPVVGQTRLAMRNPTVRKWADKRTEELLSTMLPPDRAAAVRNRPAGVNPLLAAARNPANNIGGYNAGQWAQGFLTTRVARNIRYGEESGEAISDAKSLATQRGNAVREQTHEMLGQALNDLMGKEENRSWLKRGLGILSGARKAETELKGLPQILYDGIITEAYDLAQKKGVALWEGIENSPLPEVRAAARYTPFIGRERRAQAVGDTEAAVRKIRDVAERNKFSPDLAEKRFLDFSQRMAEVDALHGYHVSGIDFIERKFVQAVTEKTGNAKLGVEVWNEVARRGMNGQDFMDIGLNLKQGTWGYRTTGGRVEGPRPGEMTVRELMQGTDTFSALDLGAYFNAIPNGHMRRTYAMFHDKKSADNWINSLDTGKVVMSNLLSDDMIDEGLRAFAPSGGTGGRLFNRGPSVAPADARNVAALIKDYRSTLEGAGRGTILTQRGIITHLLENGVNKADATDAYAALVKQMNPELSPVIANLRDISQKYIQQGEQGRGRGTGFYGERDDEINREFLEQLGEYANPVLSLTESGDAARTRITRQDFMRDVHAIASEQGLIKDGRHINEYGTIFTPITEGESAYGAFFGKHIHPYLKAELDRAMKPPPSREVPFLNALQRVRGLVTGGYLASPATVTTNLFGGLYAGAMADINPVRYTKALAQTFMPLYNKQSQHFDELSTMIDAGGGGSIVGADARVMADEMKLIETGITRNTVPEMVDHMGKLIGQQLQAPLGQKWAGLEGFQFVEKWMRTAAYKAELDYYTANPQRLARYGVDVSNPNAIKKFAAQKARISVLDYSELPDAVTMLRDSGFLMFPGFAYLITARNLNAAVNRPGKIAMADRFSEAIWSAQMDDEEKMAVYAGMPEWLREDKGVPVRMMIDEAGDKRWSMIPFGQLLPTNTTFGKPFAESLTTLGLYTPLFELAYAAATGSGEAVFTGKYGKEVFAPDARGGERVTQAVGFLANSIAPGFYRKGTDLVGAGANAVKRMTVPMDAELGATIYSYQEMVKEKAQRRFADEVTSFLIRSPTVITTSGPLANFRKEGNRLRIKRDTELRRMRSRLQEALYKGDTKKAERIQAEIQERAQEYAELTQALAAMAEGGTR